MPPTDLLDPPALLGSARRGERRAFELLTEPHRPALQLHCYRMLGSFHDAEDLVQETLVRAWRGIGRFEARSSFKNWLYRIATNACLNAIESRARRWRRVLPEAYGPPAEGKPEGGPDPEIPWLEPFPGASSEPEPGPDARYERREAVRLAFVAAIQHLPPRQRAVLLLRDVLGWPAAEAAALLDTSTAAANSALQRARSTLAARFPEAEPGGAPAPGPDERDLLARYLAAWEAGDLDGFVGLLKEDAVHSMPPWREWYDGRAAIGRFFAPSFAQGGPGAFRLLPTEANGQPAFAQYTVGPVDCPERVIHVLTLDGGAIAATTFFPDPAVFVAFDVPADPPE